MKTSTKRNFRVLAAMAGLLFACATANASLVRFEYTGSVESTSGGVEPEVELGTIVEFGVTLDTSYFTPATQFGDQGSGLQLIAFNAPLLVSDLRLAAGDRILLSLDGPAPGGFIAGQLFDPLNQVYDGSMGYTDGNRLIAFDYDSMIRAVTAEAFLGSDDPIGDLLLQIPVSHELGLTFSLSAAIGEWGVFHMHDLSVSVQRVPEPALLPLAFTGVIALLACRRKRRRDES